jgi:hypothetical protein
LISNHDQLTVTEAIDDVAQAIERRWTDEGAWHAADLIAGT